MKEQSLTRYLLTLALYVAVVLCYPVSYQKGWKGLTISGYEPMEVAVSLVHGAGFANPYQPVKTGPTAHVSPVYPGLLATIISAMPGEASAWCAIQCFATFLVLLQLRALPSVAEKIGLGFYAGIMAAGLWLIGEVPRTPAWEQNLSGLLMTLVAYFMYKGLTNHLSRREVALAGLLWGLLILTCPMAVLALAIWAVLMVRKRLISSAQVLVLVSIVLLAVGPWIARNYATFHRFVFVRDNLGLELEVSNNPCAAFSVGMNVVSGCYAEHHPDENFAQATAVRDLGEIAYNQQRLAVAKQWIRENPSAFLRLTAKRTLYFWLPSALQIEESVIAGRDPKHIFLSPWRNLVVSLASLMALVGLLRMWQKNRAAATVLLIWLLTYPPIFYVTASHERARIPLMWAILLAAGYAATELWQGLALRYGRATPERVAVEVEA